MLEEKAGVECLVQISEVKMSSNSIKTCTPIGYTILNPFLLGKNILTFTKGLGKISLLNMKAKH